MPLSTPSRKFLLDENVHRGLYKYLKKNGYDVIFAPKSSTDKQLVKLSKTEKRILVTNDEDFIYYSKDDVFSVVWLRIAQGDLAGLISSFGSLLEKFGDFSEKVVILERGRWRIKDREYEK